MTLQNRNQEQPKMKESNQMEGRKMRPTKTINEFTDAELAAMVRNSIYVKNTRFDEDHSRFLLVLAVPYGEDDHVDHVADALEGFRELLDSDDWGERSFQVYDHAACQPYFEAAYEDVEDREPEDWNQ